MFARELGLSVEASTVNEWLTRAKENYDIEGITLLGGEPTEQAAGLLPVIRHAQGLGLNVMIFSGRTLEELRSQGCPAIDELLDRTDLLVDGPFDSQRKDNNRRWVGSTNQRIHDLSGRMKPDDSQWAQSNTVEIRLEGSGNQLALTINGFPWEGGASLWKRIPLASFEPEKKR